MKELDCTKVVAEINDQMDETDFDLENLVGRTLAVMMVMNIYLTNDVIDAYGQDLKEMGVSIITTRNRCSVIIAKYMSWYKLSVPICSYENLTDDIESILMIIQAAIDRINR